MEIFTIILMLLIAVGAGLFHVRKHLKNTKKAILKTSSELTGKTTYHELRGQALSVTPQDLGIETSEDSLVYGIIMDWEMQGCITTVTAFKTGDASLYLSSGGGIIGGGMHKNINDIAINLTEFANSFIELAIPAKLALLPQENKIRFHLLTNKGLYTGQEFMHKIKDETSKWYPLFIEVNNLIYALRTVSEK